MRNETMGKGRVMRTGPACLALVLTAVFGAWVPPAGAATATWMGGPGCGGRSEWRQHPTEFPYFCDGAAVIEHARWQNWGKATATGHATMNEADLRHASSVAGAPRIRSAITLTATHLETCSGRRAYTSVRIHFDKPPHDGVSTLQYPMLLPHCFAGPPRLESFLSPDRKVWCQIVGGSPGYPGVASCGTYPEPPTHAAFLYATGRVEICALQQLEYPGGPGQPPKTCYQNWATKLPVLNYGRQTEAKGFRCTSATDGITCVVVSGAGAGKGFRVSSTEAVQVG